MLGVHAERDELDARAVGAEPCAQLLDLAPAVRDDRMEPTERVGEEPWRGRPSQLLETLGKTDRGVDDRRLHATEAPEQRQRDPDRVDGRVDDVRAVQLAERREDTSEVARVPPAEPHRSVEHARRGTRPRARLELGLEVMTQLEARARELVQPVQAVPRRVSGGCAQRFPTQRRVAVEDERADGFAGAGLGHVG